MPQWLRSPRAHNSKPSSPCRFSFSSLKDIHDIVREEPGSEPGSPKSPSIFHRVKLLSKSASYAGWGYRRHSLSPLSSIVLPEGEHRIIVYFTSLRVVRKTFEDCRTVRSILRGLGVPIEERDLSLDAKFLDELVEILGRKNFTLPKVFIGGRFVGGADETKRLHENSASPDGSKVKEDLKGPLSIGPTTQFSAHQPTCSAPQTDKNPSDSALFWDHSENQ